VSTLLRWVRSTLRGEASTADLSARLRGGSIAYSLAEEAEAATGDDRGVQLFRLCAWNAFALQTIAQRLLEIDAQRDPGTAGYVPRSTLRFASDCVDEVPQWIRHARVLQGDPTARIAVELPARLPKWHLEAPTTLGELECLRGVYDALAPRVESGVEAYVGPPRTAAQLRRTRAEMSSAADFVEAVLRPALGPVDRGEVRWRLLDALGRVYLLGQLLAVPTLVEAARVEQQRTEGLWTTTDASWLQVEPGWVVLDREGERVGLVERTVGGRLTCELEHIDVTAVPDRATVCVPSSAVATIDVGEIRLAVSRNELHR
jgi:hypothetical protein